MLKSVWGSCCAVAMLWLLAGCCGEVRETKSDVGRYSRHQLQHLDPLVDQIGVYVKSNLDMMEPLAADTERYLVWRKHEWWNLKYELAVLVHYEWAKIAKLMRDVARGYGYNIAKFPQAQDDVIRFFAMAKGEWGNLLKDVSIFVEYNMRKRHQLGADMERWFETLDWEYANMRIDVASFLEWREREYAKLAGQASAYFSSNLDLVADFKQDVGRFAGYNLTDKPKLFMLDLEYFVQHEIDQFPPLNDDFYRFWLANTKDIKLREDCSRSMTMAKHEAGRLKRAIGRYGKNQAEETRKLLRAFDRWRYTYEREYGPLKADVARYWRYHLSMGKVTMNDVERFFDLGEEEYYAMKADIGRFFRYSGEEWRGLKGNLRRFFTCGRQPAFGGSFIPFPGDTYGQSKTETAVWRGQYGNIDY